jgi:hypothetical protein
VHVRIDQQVAIDHNVVPILGAMFYFPAMMHQGSVE